MSGFDIVGGVGVGHGRGKTPRTGFLTSDCVLELVEHGPLDGDPEEQEEGERDAYPLLVRRLTLRRGLSAMA
jgi:hypothetical protein